MVDQKLHVFDKFDLQGITWHYEQSYDNRHYISNDNVNEVWHNTNDTAITQEEMFRPIGDQVPYIVVSEKQNMQATPNRNGLNSPYGSLIYEIDEIPMETEHNNDHA